MMLHLLIYLFAVNIITFVLFGEDKKRAVKHKWRISEAVLFGAAALGGSIGAMAGMYTFHHKTYKIYFLVGMPAILFGQILLYIICT